MPKEVRKVAGWTIFYKEDGDVQQAFQGEIVSVQPESLMFTPGCTPYSVVKTDTGHTETIHGWRPHEIISAVVLNKEPKPGEKEILCD